MFESSRPPSLSKSWRTFPKINAVIEADLRRLCVFVAATLAPAVIPMQLFQSPVFCAADMVGGLLLAFGAASMFLKQVGSRQ